MTVKDIIGKINGTAIIVHEYIKNEKLDREQIILHLSNDDIKTLSETVNLFADYEISEIKAHGVDSIVIRIQEQAIKDYCTTTKYYNSRN